MYPKTIDSSTLSSAITSTTSAELQVLTTPGIVAPLSVQRFSVRGWFQLTIPTSCTSVTIKLYRGSAIGGSAIWTSGAITVTAGNIISLPFSYIETDVSPDTQFYTVSVTFTAASVNGTVSFATLEAATY